MNLEDTVGSMRSEIIKSVQEIVRIKSVESQPKPNMPFGEGVNNALQYALNLASSMGFSVRNLNGYMGYAEYGDGDGMIGVLGHLDVVPEGTGWTFNPYEGSIHENRIYGRGTVDDKGPIIAALYGLKAIKDLGVLTNKRIRIIFGTDEESGWLDVEHYLKNDLPPDAGFTPDGMFPVINAEKGSINIKFKKEILRKSKGMIAIKSLKGGDAPNVVPNICTCELRLKDMAKLMLKDTLELYSQNNGINMSIEDKGELDVITSLGLSCHSSTPKMGKNAVAQLVNFISQFNLGQNDVSDYIKFISKYIASGTDGRSIGINYTDNISGELTLNLSSISIDEDSAEAVVNIRYPVTVKYEDIMSKILKTAEDKKVDTEILSHKEPLYLDKDSHVISILMDSYKKVTGDEACGVAIGGQTYAKAFKNMAAFGPVFPGNEKCAHMPDEYIDIDDLIKCAKIYAHAIYELSI